MARLKPFAGKDLFLDFLGMLIYLRPASNDVVALHEGAVVSPEPVGIKETHKIFPH